MRAIRLRYRPPCGALRIFVHHGFDEATVAAIGRYPQGRGLLGEVIIADRPVRLDDLGSNPSSCGFPEGHPAMSTFLGVPIVRGGHRYGNLYVTEKVTTMPGDAAAGRLLASGGWVVARRIHGDEVRVAVLLERELAGTAAA